MKTSASPNENIQVIDVIRGVSILQVLVAHFFNSGLHPQIPSAGPPDLGTRIFRHLFESGRYGVTMFFVISGFLITRLIATQPEGLFNPHFRSFYARRAGRIFPLFGLCVALGLTLIALAHPSQPRTLYCLKGADTKLTPGFWLSLGTFTFNWYKIVAPVSGLHWEVLWSLSVEEQFYLFYPMALAWIGSEKRLVRFLLFFVVLGPIYRMLWRDPSPAVNGSFGNFDAIALGALLFVASSRYGLRLSKSQGGRALLCVSGGLLLAAANLVTNAYRDKNLGSTGVALGLFLFLMGALNAPLFARPLFRVLASPGRLSYGGYLLHSSVLYLAWPLLGRVPFAGSLLIFVSLVFGVAWLSNHFFEKPANMAIRRLLVPRASKAQTVPSELLKL
jgi:peptidoglycan/LPS O-acetylase OafA/YrhL